MLIMFFKFFQLDTNTEKYIEKEGYIVNSYEEVISFCGDKANSAILIPKNYLLNGDIWEKLDSSEIYERSCLLAKTPYLSFDELWDLILNAKKEDDRSGALCFLHGYHYRQLREKYRTLVEAKEAISKTERRAMKLLSSLM